MRAMAYSKIILILIDDLPVNPWKQAGHIANKSVSWTTSSMNYREIFEALVGLRGPCSSFARAVLRQPPCRAAVFTVRVLYSWNFHLLANIRHSLQFILSFKFLHNYLLWLVPVSLPHFLLLLPLPMYQSP